MFHLIGIWRAKSHFYYPDTAVIYVLYFSCFPGMQSILSSCFIETLAAPLSHNKKYFWQNPVVYKKNIYLYMIKSTGRHEVFSSRYLPSSVQTFCEVLFLIVFSCSCHRNLYFGSFLKTEFAWGLEGTWALLRWMTIWPLIYAVSNRNINALSK